MSTVFFPERINRGRPYLWVECLVAYIGGLSLMIAPKLVVDFPLVYLIEKVTGLPHVSAPSTPEERRVFVIIGIFPFNIGILYTLFLLPYWKRGGEVFLQISIDGRLSYGILTAIICIFTNHGSSLLAFFALADTLLALLTQLAVGPRRSVLGISEGNTRSTSAQAEVSDEEEGEVNDGEAQV